ncbi:g-protein coupled receptor [Holotrichia oblita]|uniref:G-protein coupled receptor n=1 Tax=Holotrichia oblita TaxID=644536 RepID=A0ACB9SWJ5_HOLOL|nr:g-protein coupled receptor [Holotrichia oblita]
MDENLTFLIDDNIYLNVNGSNLEAILGPKRDNLRVVITMTVIYAIIFLSGIIGNVSTCIVIVTNKSMHTATNYYLLNLAISDLLLLVTGLPQEMYSIWSRYPYIFGYAFCILRGLFAETSANATVLTVTAFTVERYVAICHPFLSHTLSKLSRIIKLIFVIWLIAFCSAIPQALQFGVMRFVDDVPESDMCQVVNPIMMHSFELSTFLFFVAPMTLITVLYVLIGIRLRKSTTLIKKNHKECKTSKGKKNVYYNRNYKHQNTQSSRKIVKMLGKEVYFYI